MQLFFNPLTRISQFLALCFYAPKMHKPKNWLYNACLNKTIPSSRNASPIIILFYSPLNSHSDGSNHRNLHGKLPSSAGFKSFIFNSLLCFFTTPWCKWGHNFSPLLRYTTATVFYTTINKINTVDTDSVFYTYLVRPRG